ncbi:MAG: hypothetical protein ABSD71_13950 [Bacteroidales bacterium]|jgi:hypothetical protein
MYEYITFVSLNTKTRTDMKTKSETNPTIFTVDGVKYISLPEVPEFTGMERGTIQQRINRDRGKDTLKVKRIKTLYVFVPYDVCLKWKEEAAVDRDAEEIKKILSKGITLAEIEEMMEKKLEEKNAKMG